MIRKILVNPETSFIYDPKRSKLANKSRIHLEMMFLDAMLRHRGYLYLNQIYEVLGVKWIYYYSNHPIMCDEDSFEEFFTIEDDDEHNGFIVNVKHDCI